MSTWKRDMASGLIVVVPILVSLYVVAWFYWQLAGVPILQTDDPTWYQRDPVRVVVFLAVFGLGVLSIGYLMRTTLGTFVERKIDDAANRLPIVRVVYNASKMAVETAVTGTEDLQQPVKVEPWNGVRLTAFKTGKTTDDGRDILFMPTSPNITSGFVIEVAPGDYDEVDEGVEDALTRVLSAGFGESQKERGVAINVEENPERKRDQDRDRGSGTPSTE